MAGMSRAQIVNTRNRILSQNIQMTLDTRHTDLNNNILVIGGSGSGKTYRFVKPQLMQMSSSFIITDPKGELYRDTSGFLKRNGYDVKVLNLLNEEEMLKSSHFNPFRYIQNEVDILKLITNLIANTTPKGSTSNDPFWEKAEGMLLQALFYYVWLEGVPENIWECKKENGEDDVKEILRRSMIRKLQKYIMYERNGVIKVCGGKRRSKNRGKAGFNTGSNHEGFGKRKSKS